MKPLVAAVALSVLAAAPLRAQAVAGEWDGTLNTPGAQVPLKLILQLKGDSLLGTVKRTSGDVLLAGRVKGDSVVFSYTIQYGDNPFTMHLRGRVKDDSLAGIVDFGGGNTESFSAQRVVKKP